MLPQVVCCAPSRTFIADTSGNAYSWRRLDDEAIGSQSSYSGPSALRWLVELVALICLPCVGEKIV